MCLLSIFFLNDPATPEIDTYLHTLSLPDALPISQPGGARLLHLLLGRGNSLLVIAGRGPHDLLDRLLAGSHRGLDRLASVRLCFAGHLAVLSSVGGPAADFLSVPSRSIPEAGRYW